MTKEDVPFITRTILFSYQSGNRFIRSIDKDSYLRNHNLDIPEAIGNSDCLLVVDTKDQSLILGFIAFHSREINTILHYVYVRNDFRGMGISRKMLEIMKEKSKSQNLILSHLTDSFKPAAMKKYGYSKVLFNPYILRIYT